MCTESINQVLAESLADQCVNIKKDILKSGEIIVRLVKELAEVRKAKCACEIYNVGIKGNTNSADIVIDKNCPIRAWMLKG